MVTMGAKVARALSGDIAQINENLTGAPTVRSYERRRSVTLKALAFIAEALMLVVIAITGGIVTIRVVAFIESLLN